MGEQNQLQRIDTIEAATARFHLTPEERQMLLLGADKGEGLLLIRGNRIPIQLVASQAEYRLATTNPRDLERLAQEAHLRQGNEITPAAGAAEQPALGEI
jgi:hypothetical protein